MRRVASERAARRIALLATLLFAWAVLWPAPVGARWRTSGIFPCGNFSDSLAAAEDGDVLAPGAFDPHTGPFNITLGALTIEGGWYPDVNTFGFNDPAECSDPNDPNAPSPFFLRGPNDNGDYYYSTITSSNGSALTLGPAVRQLTLDRIRFDPAGNPPPPPSDGGWVVGTVISDTAQIRLQNVELTGGHASGQGGGAQFVLDGGSSLVITGDPCATSDACRSRIFGNVSGVGAPSGSAPGSGGLFIELRGGSQLVIENTTIQNNTAAGSGGGFTIRILDGSTVTIRNSFIVSNTANGNTGGDKQGGGGHIELVDGTVTIEGNSFSGNTSANGNGGALAVDFTSGALTITGNSFSNNNAALYGGAVAVVRQGDGPASLTIADNTLSGNDALSDDGIYTSGFSSAFLPLVIRQ